MRITRWASEIGAVVRELLRSPSLIAAALIVLPYAGVLFGLGVAAHYGALTNADLPVQFYLASDGGFGEWFEYSLTVSITVLLLLLWRKDRDWAYLANAMLFIWVTLDNSLEIHEQSGKWLAPLFENWHALPVGANDIGEAAMFLAIGLIWLSGLAISLKNARLRPALFSILLAACIAGAAAFGVIVDMAVVWGRQTPVHHEVATFIEDGGEFVMICLSFFLTVAIYDTERRRRKAGQGN